MFRQKLMSFMYGRYGADQLSIGLIVAAVILQIIAVMLSPFKLFFAIFRLLQAAVLVFAVYRMFSKNIAQRQAENAWFCTNVLSKLKFGKNGANSYNQYSRGYDYQTTVSQDTPEYKYFKCKNCKTKLRVPKGKGKITITCPKCKTTFKGKS